MSDDCEIVVKSRLDMAGSEWFEGLTITHNDRGGTLFSGRLRDQASFSYFLAKMRDTGLLLLSIKHQVDESFKEHDNSDNNS